MKKIISFTDYYWPGYKAGGTIRAFLNQVDYLKNDFEFFIVTRNTDYTETEPYPGIVPDQWTTISPGVHVFYVSASGQRIGVFNRLLKEKRYDLIYIHLLFGFWYSLLPLILAKMLHDPKIVIAPHGNLGSGALHVKPAKKKVFLKAVRLIRLYKSTIFHSVTEHETADIRKHIGGDVTIAEARELPRKVTTPPVRKQKTAGKLSLVTVARISPEKNQLYALEILQQCKDAEITYDLIGPVYSEEYWGRCQAVIRQMPGNVTVNYRGSINGEKIPATLQDYDVMLLPTTGENFGHTILESFMAGCPVIISDRTPWRNLEASGTGMDLPLETPDRFREAVGYFAGLGNPEFSNHSARAFTYAQAYVANPEMLAENINLFNR